MPHKADDPKWDEALKKAFDKVPPPKKGKWHEVTTYVKGSNPIDMYRVVLDEAGSDDPGGA